MMQTTEPMGESATPAVPPLSATASRARRRALIAIAAMGGLLVALWFGDALAGLLPTAPYAPTTRTAGNLRVTLALSPAQPRAGAPFAAQLAIADARHQPVPAATVTYAWEMVSMDMGTATGHADPVTAAPGHYAARVTAAMGGTWRLTVRIHQANQADATTSFDLRVHS